MVFLAPSFVSWVSDFSESGLQGEPTILAPLPSQPRTMAPRLRLVLYSVKSSMSVEVPGCANFTPFL